MGLNSQIDPIASCGLKILVTFFSLFAYELILVNIRDVQLSVCRQWNSVVRYMLLSKQTVNYAKDSDKAHRQPATDKASMLRILSHI